MRPTWSLNDFFWEKSLSHNFNQIRLVKRVVVGRGKTTCPPSLLSLKKKTRTSRFQQNEHTLNLCTVIPSIKSLSAHSIRLKTLAPRLWGFVSTIKALLYDSWTIINKMTISRFLLYFGTIRSVCVCGGGVATLRSLWLLKMAIQLLITANDHINLRSLYDHTFNKKLYMSIGHNLKPLPWGLWGVVILRDIISKLFNYVEHNSCLKIFIKSVRENNGCGGRGVFALLPFLTVRKATSPLNFQSNESFLIFLRQLRFNLRVATRV